MRSNSHPSLHAPFASSPASAARVAFALRYACLNPAADASPRTTSQPRPWPRNRAPGRPRARRSRRAPQVVALWRARSCLGAGSAADASSDGDVVDRSRGGSTPAHRTFTCSSRGDPDVAQDAPGATARRRSLGPADPFAWPLTVNCRAQEQHTAFRSWSGSAGARGRSRSRARRRPVDSLLQLPCEQHLLIL